MPSKKLIHELKVSKEKGKARGKPFPKGHTLGFQPGVSGNPGGRPKGTGAKRISDAYNGALSQDIGPEMKEKLGIDPDKECSWADAIAIQTLRKAVDSDSSNVNFTAITEIRETTEGKTPDKSEITGSGGSPLTAPEFVVNFIDPPARKPAAEEATTTE